MKILTLWSSNTTILQLSIVESLRRNGMYEHKWVDQDSVTLEPYNDTSIKTVSFRLDLYLESYTVTTITT